jgi:hypothetical protein
MIVHHESWLNFTKNFIKFINVTCLLFELNFYIKNNYIFYKSYKSFNNKNSKTERIFLIVLIISSEKD